MIVHWELDIDQNLRICNAAEEYYSMAESPSRFEYEMWLESLDEPLKQEYKELGFEKCKAKLNFKRFYLELHDIGMDEFMRNHLFRRDYEFWKKTKLFVR